MKPWVWILWIGGGPLIESFVFQLYIFLSVRLTWSLFYTSSDSCYAQTGSLVRTEAIVTSLVFDHSLRIRLKAEAAEKRADDDTSSGTATPASTNDGNGKGANTPDTASDGGEDDETVHSRTATNASTATSSTATVVPPTPAKGKDGKKDGKKNDKKDVAKDASKKGSNLVGKINNLVTSDLDNITGGRDFLFLGELSFTCFLMGELTEGRSALCAIDGGVEHVVLVQGPRMEVC